MSDLDSVVAGISVYHYKLLECPFCGSRAELWHTEPHEGYLEYYVKCSYCNVATARDDRAAWVVGEWNKRV